MPGLRPSACLAPNRDGSDWCPFEGSCHRSLAPESANRVHPLTSASSHRSPCVLMPGTLEGRPSQAALRAQMISCLPPTIHPGLWLAPSGCEANPCATRSPKLVLPFAELSGFVYFVCSARRLRHGTLTPSSAQPGKGELGSYSGFVCCFHQIRALGITAKSSRQDLSR